VKARDVLTALRRHHDRLTQPWVVLREAFGIDALAISQSRTNNFRRIAYEVKVSRGDFYRELDRWPRKAAAGLRLAHQFVFVVPEGMLGPEDMRRDARGQLRLAGTRRRRLWVPPEAGLMEVNEDRVCRMRLRAPITEAPAWSDQETAYLVAYAHRPGVIATAEWKALSLQQELSHAEQMKQQAAATTEKARARLRELGPVLVQPGSRWRVPGRWAPPVPRADAPGRFRWDDGPVDCEVIELRPSKYSGEAVVRLRRADGLAEHAEDGWPHGVALDQFLLECDRLERDGEVVPLRRSS
jgi:hypothetical protein